MKNIFKKLSVFTIIIASALLLVSCRKDISNPNSPKPNPNPPIAGEVEPEDTIPGNLKADNELNVYYLNDTHGAILENGYEIGLSKIGNMIIDEFDKKPENTIFLTGGDMFQGQLISNKNNGSAMVELLNEMQLDAFVIGNHEFDWGIDVILEYFNPNTTGVKANFPALGANIFKKGTTELLDNVEPYTIIERNGIKVGVIGIMGYGLESSIRVDRIGDYEFGHPDEIVKKYTRELKIEHDVDVVFVAAHDSHDDLNSGISGRQGNERVDAIFNGHSHRRESGHVLNTPHLQAGRNGEVLGKIKIEYGVVDGQVYIDKNLTKMFHLRQYDDLRLQNKNTKLDLIIDKYYEEVKELYEETVIFAGESVSQSQMSKFITRAMVAYTGADIGIQNNGGTRAGFTKGQKITAADIFQVFPFDNELVVYESLGSKLNKFYSGSWLTHYKELSAFNSNTTYRVATNDYVFLSNTDQSITGESVLYSDLYEFLLVVMKDIKASGQDEFFLDAILVPRK